MPDTLADAGNSAPGVGWGTAGNLVGPEPNSAERAAARRHPQVWSTPGGPAEPGWGWWGAWGVTEESRRFDPVEEPRVPLAGHLPLAPRRAVLPNPAPAGPGQLRLRPPGCRRPCRRP